MKLFQKIVLFIAIILLIIILTFISISLAGKAPNQTWPPIVSSCPDYWVIDGSCNNTKCINTKDLGTCPPTGGNKHLVMNFKTSNYTGSSGPCNKYTWANNCGVSWDGINYGINNPCG